jgi:hypothetical protein
MSVTIAAGSLPLGRCEILEGEGVMTNFFFVGPFLLPLDTVYSIGLWRGRRGFAVKRHAKSVALAYFRWFVAPLALLITFIAGAGNSKGSPQLSDGVTLTLVLMLMAWLALIFVVGRTRGRDARQRRMLSAFAGHGAPPELLFSGTLGLVAENLNRAWVEHGAAEESYRADAKSAVSWKDLYPKDVPSSSLPLYYALCRYEAALADEPVLANRARLAWDRIEGDWGTFEPLTRTKGDPVLGGLTQRAHQR